MCSERIIELFFLNVVFFKQNNFIGMFMFGDYVVDCCYVKNLLCKICLEDGWSIYFIVGYNFMEFFLEM